MAVLVKYPQVGVVWRRTLAHGSLGFLAWLNSSLPFRLRVELL